jgi:hypothetical protein
VQLKARIQFTIRLSKNTQQHAVVFELHCDCNAIEALQDSFFFAVDWSRTSNARFYNSLNEILTKRRSTIIPQMVVSLEGDYTSQPTVQTAYSTDCNV